MQRKIMFVGAGPHQIAGIIKAKEMGLFVIATDANQKSPGLNFADLPYIASTRDIKENLKIAKKNKIDGVLSISSESSVVTVATISQKLNLPGIGIDVAERSTDKALMRSFFQKKNVPSPKSYFVNSYKELTKRINEIGYPMVIKPVDSAGSRGVMLIKEKNYLKKAYEKALENSQKKKVIIEEFMDGLEVSVEAFVYNKKINIIALSDKERTNPPYLLDTKVLFPSIYEQKVKNQIIKISKKAIEAIGINIGPVHVELIMTKNGPIPVELASRGPGFKVFTDILPAITGIDMVKNCIRIAMGEDPILRKTIKKAAVIHFISSGKGVLTDVLGLEQAKKIRGIKEVELYVNIGDKVNSLTCGADRIGHIISIADTRKEALEAVEKSNQRLKLKIKHE